ncbi:hypothetical protein V6N11_067671 [Hibiscus sabdariffa]|uniref:Uncharacterized protein n=1 Tax=Hibiscus sabdariffa TaxID=183260 RepID=A0ABR2SSC0_9ROSI
MRLLATLRPYSLKTLPHSFPSELSFPMIHDSLLCHLDDFPSNDEIHAALFEMAPLKSPELGALRDHLLVGASVCTFTELLDANGEWDIDKLSTTFTAEAISHIISARSPDPHDVEDMIIWRWSRRHNFEVSSAYSHILVAPWDGKE